MALVLSGALLHAYFTDIFLGVNLPEVQEKLMNLAVVQEKKLKFKSLKQIFLCYACTMIGAMFVREVIQHWAFATAYSEDDTGSRSEGEAAPEGGTERPILEEGFSTDVLHVCGTGELNRQLLEDAVPVTGELGIEEVKSDFVAPVATASLQNACEEEIETAQDAVVDNPSATTDFAEENSLLDTLLPRRRTFAQRMVPWVKFPSAGDLSSWASSWRGKHWIALSNVRWLFVHFPALNF